MLAYSGGVGELVRSVIDEGISWRDSDLTCMNTENLSNISFQLLMDAPQSQCRWRIRVCRRCSLRQPFETGLTPDGLIMILLSNEATIEPNCRGGA